MGRFREKIPLAAGVFSLGQHAAALQQAAVALHRVFAQQQHQHRAGQQAEKHRKQRDGDGLPLFIAHHLEKSPGQRACFVALQSFTPIINWPTSLVVSESAGAVK